MAPQMKQTLHDASISKSGHRSSLLEITNAHEDTTELVNTIKAVIEENFPGSLSSADTLKKISKVMEDRCHTDDNTLFAQSVCPDEINHEPGDITNLFTEYFGEVFHLGGLGGIPFTGKTGFAAYSHHVPEDGHCFILMAPHIGLDSALDLGKYDREGQSSSGAACGAAIGALCHCQANKPMPDLMAAENDYQMSYIIHKVNQAKDAILKGEGANTQQALLATHMHEVAKTMLDKIVTLDFGGSNSTLTILTGIQINMPEPMEDYFQPLSFYTMDKLQGNIDLFEQTFGMVSPRKQVYCTPVATTSKKRPTLKEQSSGSTAPESDLDNSEHSC